VRLGDTAAGGFVLALGVLAMWQAAAIRTSPIFAQVGPKAVPYGVAAALLVLGALLVLAGLRGGWSHGLEDAQPAPANPRALGLVGLGLLANLLLIGPAGFSVAASVQFVLVAAGFGSRRPGRDLAIGLALSLSAWFGFVMLLDVNIGAGLLEGALLRLFGVAVEE
jgi:putative tricarboxylic transport membrane protein